MKFPKVGKRMRTQRQVDAALDRQESTLVKARSGGRCEVSEVTNQIEGDTLHIHIHRCSRRAVHVMHLIGGNGRRGRNISALAIHKLHGCPEHHREIDGDLGGKKLRRIGGPIPMWTDCYERTKPRAV